jgi:predicted MFS family arabinose efflux permease
MLELSFFRKPAFTVASLAITLCYFGLTGAILAFTQYLQFARGFSALKAGVIMLALIPGLIAGGGNSDRLAKRLGSPKVITGGLVGLAATMATALLWTPSTAVWVLALTLAAMAFFMSNVMAPASESVMSAIPESKSGVGSAMNDVNRQIGGALGVAIIGSIMNSIFSSRMTVVASQLPAGVRPLVRDSIGSAYAVAQHLPAAMSHHVETAAAQGLTHALGIGFLAAAISTALAAPIVKRLLPDRRTATRTNADPRLAEAAATA